MTLTDTGPLVALLDRRQHHHQICLQVFKSSRLPLITTWACFTEAMYFCQREGGHPFQRLLWQFINLGALRIYQPADRVIADKPDVTFLARIEQLMEKYVDSPMDFADASLVAASERLRLLKVFTLDKKDFRIYRNIAGQAFEIVPD